MGTASAAETVSTAIARIAAAISQPMLLAGHFKAWHALGRRSRPPVGTS